MPFGHFADCGDDTVYRAKGKEQRGKRELLLSKTYHYIHVYSFWS